MSGGANLYPYVTNSPLSNGDPSGEMPSTNAIGEWCYAARDAYGAKADEHGLRGYLMQLNPLYVGVSGPKAALGAAGDLFTLGTKYEHYYEHPCMKTLPGAATDCLVVATFLLPVKGMGAPEAVPMPEPPLGEAPPVEAPTPGCDGS